MQPISTGAAEVTKLTRVNGQLYYNEKLVLTDTIEEVLLEFINVLKTIEKPVLVENNIRTFDLIFLYNNLTKFVQWNNFLSVVMGFGDTLQVFKKEFSKKLSYK